MAFGSRRCRVESTHRLDLLAEILTSIYLICFFLCNFSYGQKLQLFVDWLTLESILCVWLGGLRRSS